MSKDEESLNFITPVIHCENINKNDQLENFKVNNIVMKYRSHLVTIIVTVLCVCKHK